MQLIEPFISVVRDNETAQIAIIIVFTLIILDYVFGVTNALIHKQFSSDKMREGIAHKCAELGFVLIGCLIDTAIISDFDFGFQSPMLLVICSYIAIMEIGSLLEIFAEMNPQLADSPLFQLLHSVKVNDHENS